MNTNRILLAGLAGAVTFFILGGIIYGVVLTDFITANTFTGINKDNSSMEAWAMVLSNLAWGLLLAVIFGKWTEITRWDLGLQAGAVIGLLTSIAFDFAIYASTRVFNNLAAVTADVASITVITSLAGAVVAWILGTGNKEASVV